MTKEKKYVYLLIIQLEDDSFEVEGVFDLEISAEKRLAKIAEENEWNEIDIDRYSEIRKSLVL